jgi:hypothetical protein
MVLVVPFTCYIPFFVNIIFFSHTLSTFNEMCTSAIRVFRSKSRVLIGTHMLYIIGVHQSCIKSPRQGCDRALNL